MSEENLYSFDNEQYRRTYWHTCSHVLAQAVKHLYPEVHFAIGPAIDNGFYYDFDREASFTPEDIEKIEKEMNRIIAENLKEERFELPRQEAIEYLPQAGRQAILRNTTLEDVFVERIGRRIDQK